MSIVRRLRQQRHGQRIGMQQHVQPSAMSLDAIERRRFDSLPSARSPHRLPVGYALIVGVPNSVDIQANLDGGIKCPSAGLGDGWRASPEWATWLLLAAGMTTVALLLVLIVHLLG